MIDKIVAGLLAFTLGFVIAFFTLVIQKKDNQINQLKNSLTTYKNCVE